MLVLDWKVGWCRNVDTRLRPLSRRDCGTLPRSGYTEQSRASALGQRSVKGALKVAPDVGRVGGIIHDEPKDALRPPLFLLLHSPRTTADRQGRSRLRLPRVKSLGCSVSPLRDKGASIRDKRFFLRPVHESETTSLSTRTACNQTSITFHLSRASSSPPPSAATRPVWSLPIHERRGRRN